MKKRYNQILKWIPDDDGVEAGTITYEVIDEYNLEGIPGISDTTEVRTTEKEVNASEEMEAWEDRYKFDNDTSPDRGAYTKKIKEQLELLQKNDSELGISKIYSKGTVNLSKAEEYLEAVRDQKKIQSKAAQLIFNICWLCERRDELADAATTQLPEPEDKDTTMLTKFMENLKPYFKRGETFKILFTARDICANELNKPYACTVERFANEIAPILEKKAASLNTQICEAGKNLKIQEKRTYHPLATLTKEQINTVPIYQKQELEDWKQRYTLVKSLIPPEMLAQDSSKSLEKG